MQSCVLELGNRAEEGKRKEGKNLEISFRTYIGMANQENRFGVARDGSLGVALGIALGLAGGRGGSLRVAGGSLKVIVRYLRVLCYLR